MSIPDIYGTQWYLNAMNNTTPANRLDVAAPAPAPIPSPAPAPAATNATQTTASNAAASGKSNKSNGAASLVAAPLSAAIAFGFAAFLLL